MNTSPAASQDLFLKGVISPINNLYLLILLGLLSWPLGALQVDDFEQLPVQANGSSVRESKDSGVLRILSLGSERARIVCRVQHIEGDLTSEGLVLRSTRGTDLKATLRVVSDYLGRHGGALVALPTRGTVAVEDSNVARFVRAQCLEEFRVGPDGIRQDFIVSRPPPGRGLLRLELQVTGARVEEQGDRIQLRFEEADRVLFYGRLHVEDASGKVLPADMVRVNSNRIAVRVDDSFAAYPLRIDPTFSDANWRGLGGLSGTDTGPSAIVVDDAGNVFIGGTFSAVGNVPVQGVAMWDGRVWSDLGEGLPITVNRLLVFENSLFAGGPLIGMQGHQVVRRDGTSWVPVGEVFNDRINALKPHLGSLYVGGWFKTIGETAANGVARWDGETWEALGSGIDGLVNDILSFDGNLIVGGAFLSAGGSPASRLARWNGSTWSAMGTGVNGDVNSLVIRNGNLIAGGSFNQAGGSAALRVAQWNGTSWFGIGGMSENFVIVDSLTVSGSTLYAAGTFREVSGQPARGLAQLNQTWSAVGTGFAGPAAVVATFGSDLYVGGGRVDEEGFHSAGFSWWDGSRWGRLGDTPVGVGGRVLTLIWHEDSLYVGGSFRTAGGLEVNGLARWDGSDWHAVGGGVTGLGTPSIRAMAFYQGDLYVAGSFDRAGEIEARNIARWDGESWAPLKGGVNGNIEAMTVFNDRLIVAGGIVFHEGNSVGNLLEWDGTDWVRTFGFGIGSSLNAVVLHEGDLYVGGSIFGEQNNIARWNGFGFSSVGSGFNGAVNALFSANGKLYAGGRFTSSGSLRVDHVAEWDGAEWKAMGSGVNLFVSALVEFGGHVLVSGERAFSSQLPEGPLLAWNGSEWSRPGSGVNGQVHTFLPVGDILYVGGNFSVAGGRVAAALATLDLQQAAAPSRALGIEVVEDSVLVRFSGVAGAAYQIVRSPRLGAMQDWLVLSESPLIADESGEFEYLDEDPLPGAGYYRAQEID